MMGWMVVGRDLGGVAWGMGGGQGWGLRVRRDDATCFP